MKRKLRQRELNKRKSFWPTLILTGFLGIILAGLVYFTDPNSSWTVPVFFVLLFLTLFFGFCLIFVNSRRSLLITSTLITFLVLRYFGVGNILNLLLILGLTVSIEVYCSKR
jgi:hypothetical protein